jgi:hypothetical protein
MMSNESNTRKSRRAIGLFLMAPSALAMLGYLVSVYGWYQAGVVALWVVVVVSFSIGAAMLIQSLD